MSSINPYQSYQPRYPDRPIYRAADAYYHAYPYTNALSAAVLTPGNRMDKYDAATDALTYGLGYRAASTMAVNGMNKLYEKYPKLADFANRHPFLAGIPVLVVGVLAGEVGGRLSMGGGRFAKRRLGVNKAAEKVLYSKPGNLAAKWLKPVERFLNRPGVKWGVAIGGLAALGVLVFRLIQDNLNFARQYKAARQDQPSASPYALNQAVAQQLAMHRQGVQRPVQTLS